VTKRIVHWLMDQQWLCSNRWHGRLPFAPWCLVAWAYEECGKNHPEDWEEVEVEIARPLMVTRPARTDGMNIYVGSSVTTANPVALKYQPYQRDHSRPVHMTRKCHCGQPGDIHGDEHRGKCCDCFDSEVLGGTFEDDPNYCATRGGPDDRNLWPRADTPAT
jgi:hypothetical protein